MLVELGLLRCMNRRCCVWWFLCVRGLCWCMVLAGAAIGAVLVKQQLDLVLRLKCQLNVVDEVAAGSFAEI